MSEIHNAIMNLPCKEPEEYQDAAVRMAYRVGHRDARHAAAELVAALEAERDALRKDRERYQWLANRVLGCDYGDNDAPGQQNGWRIVHDLLAHNGRQPAFMYGTSIDAAIDAAIAHKGAEILNSHDIEDMRPDEQKMSERDEFEAAWGSRYPDHGNSAFRRSELIAHGYANTRVNDGWAMWQAARRKSWGGYVPDGWKLVQVPPEPPRHPGPPPAPPDFMVVPIHPTKEMREAGAKIGNQGWDFAHHTWRTMLLHAPAAPQPSQEPAAYTPACNCRGAIVGHSPSCPARQHYQD